MPHHNLIARLVRKFRPESVRAFDRLLHGGTRIDGPSGDAMPPGACVAWHACHMDELIPERCATCARTGYFVDREMGVLGQVVYVGGTVFPDGSTREVER